jgi:hypothetical protein
MTALARARSNCKRQTRPLVRESSPYQKAYYYYYYYYYYVGGIVYDEPWLLFYSF